MTTFNIDLTFGEILHFFDSLREFIQGVYLNGYKSIQSYGSIMDSAGKQGTVLFSDELHSVVSCGTQSVHSRYSQGSFTVHKFQKQPMLTKLHNNLGHEIGDEEVRKIINSFCHECLSQMKVAAANEATSEDEKKQFIRSVVDMVKTFLNEAEKLGMGQLRSHLAINRGEYL